MSLAPQASEPEPPTRVAATNPTQTAPAAAAEGGGSFLVSVTSQDSEAAARESFRAVQGKYASVLGSRSPVIKRVDLADGKTKYRAMVGPYRTRQEAVAVLHRAEGRRRTVLYPVELSAVSLTPGP